MGLKQTRKEKRATMRNPEKKQKGTLDKGSAAASIAKTIPEETAIEGYEGDVVDEEDEDSEKEMIEVFDSDDEREKWDCETIVSTYSNMENHPALIREEIEPRRRKATQLNGVQQILLSNKTGLPLGVLPTRSKKAQIVGKAVDTSINERKKNETPEEKKARKVSVRSDVLIVFADQIGDDLTCTMYAECNQGG